MSDPITPGQRRADAVDLAAQLLNPGVIELPREVAAAEGGELADQIAHHAREVERLRLAHADLTSRRLHPQARRVLARLIDHERRRRGLVAAVERTSAPVPSLLDQVVDAIESSSSEGRPGATAKAHRSPIGLAAAQLVGDIEQTVGRTPRPQLARQTWGWAVRHSAAPRTHTLLVDWVERARAVVTPARPLDLVSPCPACGESVAWLADDTGQPVRRAALQVDRATGWARCLARPHGRPCGASWDPGHLTHLAQVLDQQRADQLAAVEAEQLALFGGQLTGVGT